MRLSPSRPRAPTLALALVALASCGSPGTKPTAADAAGADPGAEDGADPGAEDGTGDSGGRGEPGDPAEPVLLSDADRLLRIAMTIKGTRPTATEYAAVAADPEALASIVDGWLDDPLFGDTVRDIENQTLLVRWETSGGRPPDDLEVSDLDWTLALNEEPLRLIQYVVENDLPYTDIVTMSGTVGSALHARIWSGVAEGFDPDGAAWQPLAHTDGRPEAGVLSTSGWHQRWASNPANAKRFAAAAAARALICVDYFSGDVQLSEVDLSDDDAIDDAILVEPACVSCHQTMDPFAGNLQGFGGRVSFNTGYPNAAWDAADADDGVRRTGRENGYYGLGGDTLTELGALMATDSRFTQCAARRYLSWMTQTPLDEVDSAWTRSAQAALVDSGMSIKAMARSIVLSDDFAVSHSPDADAAERVRGLLKARPTQLDRLFRDLTGFTWAASRRAGNPEFIVPTTALTGFRVHAGGIDSNNKTTPTHLYSAPASLFLRTFAAEAAGHVVSADFARVPAERVLLSEVERDTTDEATVRAQIATLHGRIYGEFPAADDPAVDDTLALFQALSSASGDPETGWKLLLLAMFQDVRVAFY